jgi:glycosyltransferase involved in cell wall biosynthesis
LDNEENFAGMHEADAGLKNVNILVGTFFDLNGNDLYLGGAERYLLELAKIIRKMGYTVSVYQHGNYEWVRFYQDLKVRSIVANDDYLVLNQRFHEQVEQGVLTIYFAFFLAAPLCYRPSIGISHGIFWDNNTYMESAGKFEYNIMIEPALRAVANCSKLVSVDTNTINWLRTMSYDAAEKCIYLPNFVDFEQFKVSPKDRNGNLVILYPRRLYKARGFDLIAKIVPTLLEKYANIEFHFVGQANELEAKQVLDLLRKYPSRVRWYKLPLDDMYKAYQTADIVIIPTKNSEGTSLSCLEAMACGKPIIATDVGGLPNLIIDGYNGLLIKPDSQELMEKIEVLINNRHLRDEIGKNAALVSRRFDLKIWQQKWHKILSSFLVESREELAQALQEIKIVCPAADGISWENVRQRPHHLLGALSNNNGIYCFFETDGDESERNYSKGSMQIICKKDNLYVDDPVLYIYYPYNYERIKQYKKPIVIYDILDDISIHDESDRLSNVPVNKMARSYHEKLLREADIVITSSSKLYEKYRIARTDIVLIPNAADLKHFQQQFRVCPSDFPSKTGPVVGYFGAIAKWLDYRLLDLLAQKKPNFTFVFIGPVSDERFWKLLENKNVKYLGIKKYDELPKYAQWFDIAILPFEKNDITDATSPIKMFEYMAAGKPVVATELAEVIHGAYKGVLVSKSHDEFIKNIDKALEHSKDEVFIRALRENLRGNTWADRSQKILNVIRMLKTHDDQSKSST